MTEIVRSFVKDEISQCWECIGRGPEAPKASCRLQQRSEALKAQRLSEAAAMFCIFISPKLLPSGASLWKKLLCKPLPKSRHDLVDETTLTAGRGKPAHARTVHSIAQGFPLIPHGTLETKLNLVQVRGTAGRARFNFRSVEQVNRILTLLCTCLRKCPGLLSSHV